MPVLLAGTRESANNRGFDSLPPVRSQLREPDPTAEVPV